MLMASRPLGHTTFAVVGKKGRVFLRGTVPSGAAGSVEQPVPPRLPAGPLPPCGRRAATGSSRQGRSASPRRTSGSRAPATSTDRWSTTACGSTRTSATATSRSPVRWTGKPAHLQRRRGRRLRLAAHGPRRGPDHRPGPHEDRRTGRRRGRLGGRRRLPQVHPLLGVQRRRALHQRTAARDPRAARASLAEARHGLAWLDKMWDESDRHAAPAGRHRLGQQAGHLHRRPRPAGGCPRPTTTTPTRCTGTSRTGRSSTPRPPGSRSARTSPAGSRRRSPSPSQQRGRPGQGAGTAAARRRPLYARAATTAPPKPLVTALPHAFYPESVWQDDMELGAAEIARAAQRLGLAAAPYLASSAHWAKRYLKLGSADTLNLYDVGALAHASLADAMAAVPHGNGSRSPAPQLVQGPRPASSGPGVRQARHDPFGAPVDVTEFDANSHTLRPGRQRGALRAAHRQPPLPQLRHPGPRPGCSAATRGASARWSASARRTRAACSTRSPTSSTRARPRRRGQRAERSGQLRGRAGRLPGRHAALLAARATRAFDGQGSRYVDDVRAWQTDEPALDMTAAAILAARGPAQPAKAAPK